MIVVVVAGTGTGIGKTWVAAALAANLRQRGIGVAARKPAQSFDPDDTAPTDAEVLGAATGEDPGAVCPRHRWLPRAMAPPMAADALGAAPFSVAELATEIMRDAQPAAIVLVESAGGVRSPLAADGDTVTLVDALHADAVVLVADAELGTINLVRLSVAALAHDRVVVFLNRFDASNELHARNRDWLTTREDLEVVTDPEALAEMCTELPPPTC
jgi:dethiobiotin synthetase